MQTNREPPLEQKVAYLARPAAYSDAPEAVEVVETHFAWVFLSRRLVYKLKKPIRFRELDVTTLAARRANCELEVALNRRLASRVYLGVVPLTRDGGRFELEGSGEVVEWLVKMHRLPRERMLDHAGVAGTVTDAELAVVVDKLGEFYRAAVRAPWTGADYRQALASRIDGYAAQLGALELTFDGAVVHAIADRQTAFIRAHAPSFDARIAAGRVVDAHGDLKPEHVFLGADPQIIDCLEFSAELRLLDAAEEIAFLELECERIGCDAVGRRVYELYEQRCGDAVPAALHAFHRSVRAFVRALLSAWHLGDDLGAGARASWEAQARWYLRVADAAVRAAEAGARSDA